MSNRVLCDNCKKHKKDEDCPVVIIIDALCKAYDLVVGVWDCPNFTPKPKETDFGSDSYDGLRPIGPLGFL